MSLESSDADPRYLDYDDEELMVLHLEGDAYAFGELARRHVRYLQGVARRVVSAREEADDVVQTALVSALRSAGSFRSRSTVRTWLHQIVMNQATDASRRRKVRPTTELPVEDSLALGEEDSDVGRIVEGRHTVESLLDALPLRQRRMVLMVDLLGFSVKETAERLGVPEGTVKSNRARAFRALARLLQ